MEVVIVQVTKAIQQVLLLEQAILHRMNLFKLIAKAKDKNCSLTDLRLAVVQVIREAINLLLPNTPVGVAKIEKARN